MSRWLSPILILFQLTACDGGGQLGAGGSGGQLGAGGSGGQLGVGGGSDSVTKGGVSGFVSIDTPDGRIRLPGVEAYLTTMTGQEVVRVTTDRNGRYVMPPQQSSTYRLCFEADGFDGVCEEEPLEIEGETAYPTSDASLTSSAFVRGRLVQVDEELSERLCVFDLLLSSQDSLVELRQSDGATTIRSVPTNSLGQFVVPVPEGMGSYELLGSCGNEEVPRAVVFGAEDLSGAEPYDLSFENSPPSINNLVARVGGRTVRTVEPGAPVELLLDASDPDGDPLFYHWLQESDVVMTAAPSLAVDMPEAPGVAQFTIEVTDGRGGAATQRITIPVGALGAVFEGRVVSEADGLPVAGAVVKVNGDEQTTDEGGRYSLIVDTADRYLVNVTGPAHGMQSRLYRAGAYDLNFALVPSAVVEFDPGARGAILDPTGTFAINIPKDSIVDGNGQLPNGNLRAIIDRYDGTLENGIPAHGIRGRGEAKAFQGIVGIRVRLEGQSPTPLRLVQGTPVQIGIQFDLQDFTHLPNQLSVATYDAEMGSWGSTGAADLVESQFNAEVTPPPGQTAGLLDSTIILATDIGPTACVRIITDEELTAYPYKLLIRVPSLVGGPPIVRSQIVTERYDVIEGLPPDTDIEIEWRTVTAVPERIFKTFSANSGPTVDAPVYPYEECRGGTMNPGSRIQTRVFIKGDLPEPASPYLSRKGGVFGNGVIVDLPGGGQANSLAVDSGLYTDGIGGRVDFNQWKADRGFPSEDELVVFYSNDRDLGFNRGMHCRRDGENVYCYVQNWVSFGYAFGEESCPTFNCESFGTVAMQYTPSTGSDFWIWNGDGLRISRAALSRNGDVRGDPHPQACLVCHGGVWEQETYSVRGTSFREFDVFSFSFPDRPGLDLESQQETFRKLNEMVLTTNPAEPVAALIRAMYPDGVSTPGARAVDTYVPSGWSTQPDLYNTIVKPHCRGCHITQSSRIDFTTFEQFEAFKSLIDYSVCTAHDMPHSLWTAANVWFSPGPSAPGVLADPVEGLGVGGDCAR